MAAKGCGVLFFSVFALVGAVTMYFFAGSVLGDFKTRSWVSVEAELLGQSENLERQANEQASDSERVPFRYTYEGRTYIRDTVTLSGSMKVNGQSSDSGRRLRGLPAGTKVKCFVNPAKPDEAVLEHRSLTYAWFLLLPGVFLLVGLGGAFFILRAKPADMKPVSARHGASAGNVKSGVWTLRFLGLVFALIGGAVTWAIAVNPMLEARAARSWREVPCKIQSASVQSQRGSKGGSTYRIEVVYDYEFDGRKFAGDRYNFISGSSSSRQWREDAVQRLKNEPNPICYVNPDEPSESVLSRELGNDAWFGLIPLVFVIVGGALFLNARKLAGKSAGARGVPMPMPQQRVVSLAHGGFELKPATSPKAACAGMGCVALFWNGIVWAIFLQPNMPTAPRIFLMIFVFIGLGLFGGFGYFLLSMFNPKPTLVADVDSVQLGQSIHLKWSFDGNTTRISHLEILLSAKESATYRRGTTTATDHSFFVHEKVFETRDRVSIAAGSVTLTIPADSMHSFEGANNKITWTVTLHGDIAKWPDVNLEFPITVLPLSLGSASLQTELEPAT